MFRRNSVHHFAEAFCAAEGYRSILTVLLQNGDVYFLKFRANVGSGRLSEMLLTPEIEK
jgi:hypothetical protein